MSAPLLLSVKDAMIRYAEEPIFEDLSFNIHQGSKISLVGKNGAGKSTLMNIITGAKELDAGERWQDTSVSIGYLRQDINPKDGQSVYDFILERLKETQSPEEVMLHEYKIDIIAEALHLDVSTMMTRLSGGQVRRAGLARSLVEEPDLLLLDEPTNHLDLEIIEWLEGYLRNYSGSFLCISHDKTFLSNITNKVFWLDRGKLRVSPQGFKDFENWSTLLLEQEERELKNRKKLVEQEVEWANRGVKARVKRNQARLAKMKDLRDQFQKDQSSFRRVASKVELPKLESADATSKIVAEFYNTHKDFEEDGKTLTILDGFHMRIKRGDRIGILGKNGSGKTTFLKMLIGELEPDKGRVKRRKELEFSYFDQKRSDLVDTDSLRKTLCPGGGDYLDVMGKQRHVCSYLKDFLFDPADVNLNVSALSGGQKNRLMLSKVLANPKSCLILDEPTNDLDMDTLDMLEEVLMNYEGTLIIVSHDRDFLDQTVTQILAFEGNGKIESHIGGYSDYLAHKKKEEKKKEKPSKQSRSASSEIPKEVAKEETAPTKKTGKLSYKLEYELENLPKTIKNLEKEQEQLHTKLADPEFYQNDSEAFDKATRRLSRVQKELDHAESRWLELMEMKGE